MPAREADHGIYATLRISRRGYGKGLTPMLNETTLLRYGTVRFGTVRYGTVRYGITAPFLRPAGRMELNTVFVMDDRRILSG